MANELSSLAKEIQKHLERLSWSQRTLAHDAGVGHATISRLIRGTHNPSPETLDAIAKALGVDTLHLMRLAGLPLPPSKVERDPSVEYIAQRLDALPAEMRERAVDVVGGIVDAFWEMAEQNAIYEQIKREHPEWLVEAEKRVTASV